MVTLDLCYFHPKSAVIGVYTSDFRLYPVHLKAAWLFIMKSFHFFCLFCCCVFRRNVTLKLAGNNRLRRVQRLDDKDVLALSKCLRNNTRVTGEQSGLGEQRNLDALQNFKLFFMSAGLDVRYNNITDDGAGHLADLLQVSR